MIPLTRHHQIEISQEFHCCDRLRGWTYAGQPVFPCQSHVCYACIQIHHKAATAFTFTLYPFDAHDVCTNPPFVCTPDSRLSRQVNLSHSIRQKKGKVFSCPFRSDRFYSFLYFIPHCHRLVGFSPRISPMLVVVAFA